MVLGKDNTGKHFFPICGYTHDNTECHVESLGGGKLLVPQGVPSHPNGRQQPVQGHGDPPNGAAVLHRMQTRGYLSIPVRLVSCNHPDHSLAVAIPGI
jgi:hypothetical protein